MTGSRAARPMRGLGPAAQGTGPVPAARAHTPGRGLRGLPRKPHRDARRPAACWAAALIPLFLGLAALAAPVPALRCAAFGAAARGRVTASVRARFHFSPSFHLASAVPLAGTCYVRLTFTDPARHQSYVFFLTPDRRYLTAALYPLGGTAGSAGGAAELERELAAAPSPARGPANAAVTLVEFSDFECPFCRRLARFEQALPAAEKRRLRIVFKFFPLTTIHPWAETAARAAACADFQSNAAFWAAHDFFFSRQPDLSTADAAARVRSALAKAPGFSLPVYDRCVALDMGAGIVARDQALGRRLGVTGTPTFFINGQRYAGIASQAALKAEIARALAATAAAGKAPG